MRWLKRAMRAEAAQNLLSGASAAYIRLVRATTRWDIEAPEPAVRLMANQAPVIACFWHGRLMMMPRAWQGRQPFYMLVSEHRDGVLIARTIRRFGYRTTMISRKRGPVAALRALHGELEKGHAVGITPDGPRGPRMRARPGAIRLAQLSGAAILPVTYAVSRRRLLPTWDRFCFALPFARGLILWGEPLWVPRRAANEELDRLRADLERRLNALTTEADRRFGLPAVEPAPAGHEQPDSPVAGRAPAAATGGSPP